LHFQKVPSVDFIEFKLDGTMFFFAGKELVNFGDLSAPAVGAYMASPPDSGISMTLWHKYLYFSDLSTTLGQVLGLALSPDE
jgi:hypothetical protein